ncbi:hypothetical protein D3C78_977810 [compost metagenome]
MQVGGIVAPHVAGIFIHLAPQPLMLGHGQQHDSPGLQGTVHLLEHHGIRLDVLDDIERANRFELVDVRDIARIHLHELRTGQARGGKLQPGREHLAAKQPGLRKRHGDPTQNEAGTAPDFQK